MRRHAVGVMNAIAIPRTASPAQQVSWIRLVWVAPLTVAAALAVNYAIKLVVQTLSPSLARMPQLSQPMITLTLLGAIGAVVAFVLVGLVTRRPFFWYPVVGLGALVLSWAPDIGLAMGGQWAGLAMRIMGPLTSIGMSEPSGRPPGAGTGGPPPGGGGGFTTPVEQVLVLMLLHLATAVVCVVLLTRLTRQKPEVT
jgi:hypothetical protein